MQTEAQVVASTPVEYPQTVGRALEVFNVRSSAFLRGMVLAVYAWSESKLAPDFVAIYGGTVAEALDKGIHKLRHGLAVYVCATYLGADLPLRDPLALSNPMRAFILKARAIAEKRVKMDRATERSHVDKRKRKADAHAKRDRDRANRKKARR